MYFYILLFILSIISVSATGYEYFISNAVGDVEKGNFSYFTMSYEGTIMIELLSINGDCDLYISETHSKPTYEPDSYSLQSSTCGLDSIIVPEKFNRPVAIGIFAHPSHDICTYQISFFKVSDSMDIFNYDPYTKSLQKLMDERLLENVRVNPGREESYIWEFLHSVLVFLIECFL